MGTGATAGGPRLPPILTGHGVPAGCDVLAEAVSGANSHRLGAADCLWSFSDDEACFAIVLEPDVGREAALQVGVMMFAAVADSLGVTMPPKTAVQLRWPKTVLVNGASAGEILFALADRAAGADNQLEDVADWLVVGARLAIRRAGQQGEPGLTPDRTALIEEGAGDLDRALLIQSVVSHFLAWLQRWQDDGFKPVHDAVIGRLEGFDQGQADDGERCGMPFILGLGEDAALIVRQPDGSHTAVPFHTETDTGNGSATASPETASAR